MQTNQELVPEQSGPEKPNGESVLKLQDAVLRLKEINYTQLQEEIAAVCETAFFVDKQTCKCQCAG